MGIQGLTTIIKKMCPEVQQKVHLSHFSGMRIPVDLHSILYRFKVATPDRWITSFLYYITGLRKYNIHPIFILEGRAPVEKADTKLSRMDEAQKKQERAIELSIEIEQYKDGGKITDYIKSEIEKSKDPDVTFMWKMGIVNIKYFEKKLEKLRNQQCYLDNNDIKRVVKLFDSLSIPYIQAPNEGESYCCQLDTGYVISTDTDVLAHGQSIIRDINASDGTASVINFTNLLSCLEMSMEEFLDMCILCKTDYNNKLPGVGPIGAFRLILEHRRIEHLPEKYDTSVLNFERTRELFKLPKVEVELPYWEKITMEMVESLMEHETVRNPDALLNGLNHSPKLVFKTE